MSEPGLLDWHWDEPLWPRFRFGDGQAALLAHTMTLWRCFWCGHERIGLLGAEYMEMHTEMVHPGFEPKYTAYPPALGVQASGRDA